VVELKTFVRLLLAFSAFAVCSGAQTFNALVAFDGKNGEEPGQVNLVQGTDGYMYGTTEIGGYDMGCMRPGCGTIFRVSLSGELVSLPLNGKQGSQPEAGLVLASDGNFYGTTYRGGANDDGEIFRISPDGKGDVIYSFCAQPDCGDGVNPFAPLIQAADGAFYGTTFGGGTSLGGTVFKITAQGVLTVLYNFCSQPSCVDGSEPYVGLIQAPNGNFYGTTDEGGTSSNCPRGCGTIFRISPLGIFQTLHSFDRKDGAIPFGSLIPDNMGNLYGTTYLGGDLTCLQPSGCGTIFKLDVNDKLTTIYKFDRTHAGAVGSLTLATDGNLYGATAGVVNGKTINYGTLFSLTPQGVLTTLHTFQPADGMDPNGGMIQATDGKFYGLTLYGGDFACSPESGCGTLFSLDIGLGPFVSFVRGYGRVEKSVGILGQGLIGASGVSFNNLATDFEVKSDTFLVATVPPGATTGYVKVTTPTGTLTSSKKFLVLP